MSSNQGYLILKDTTIKKLASIEGLTIESKDVETGERLDGITAAIQSSLDQPRHFTNEIAQKLCLFIKFNGKEIIIPMSFNGLAYLFSIGLTIQKAREVLAECQYTYSSTSAAIFTHFFKTSMQQNVTALEEGDELPETIEISTSDYRPHFAKAVENLYRAAYQDHSKMNRYLLGLGENDKKFFYDLEISDYVLETFDQETEKFQMLDININHLFDNGNVDEIFNLLNPTT